MNASHMHERSHSGLVYEPIVHVENGENSLALLILPAWLFHFTHSVELVYVYISCLNKYYSFVSG